MADKFFKSWNNTKVSVQDMNTYKPEAGFSEAKNKAVIAESIRLAKERRAKILKEREKGLQERSWALAQYIDFIKSHDETINTPEKFFGKRYLAQLRGQHIMQTIKRLASGESAVVIEYSKDIITPLEHDNYTFVKSDDANEEKKSPFIL